MSDCLTDYNEDDVIVTYIYFNVYVLHCIYVSSNADGILIYCVGENVQDFFCNKGVDGTPELGTAGVLPAPQWRLHEHHDLILVLGCCRPHDVRVVLAPVAVIHEHCRPHPFR